ncbi:CoxG family protein [Amycolatopsis methanolica]|uniref:Carbon monoxide dehydrogenase subunit G n=1 Tax=Amycolatopsis methanolica 239 TaxID=1068978 RepID=A0A076MVU3_AMYME|nr:SRPBCC domain-containing protein [Amycolatopsis methanolica]AIJ21902.1 carbon monoxide dehydrogenase subunit G [Amycolatopsis methanolica 239]
MVKLASSFPVPAAADKVIALFLDQATMQSCIPGCEELVQIDETHYRGILVNEVAHMKLKAGFTAEILSVTESRATGEPAVVKAVLRGEDRRLGSTIRIDATLTVTPLAPGSEGTGEGSDVAYEFDLAIRGKIGRLGESVIRRRTAEVERQFADALTAVCAGRPVLQGGGAAAQKKTPAVAAAATVSGDQVTPVGTPESQRSVVHGPTGVPEPAVAGPVRRDWLVIGLAVAASFGYGILLGQRQSPRR